MITKKELLDTILERKKNVTYDVETDMLHYDDKQVPFKEFYDIFLKKNGMSFKCICDVHWECMSVLECTECGTVIKYYYDEDYDPNFRCPTCTDYKTGFEYHTKEEIANSGELQDIIKMYHGLDKIMQEKEERRKKRNGLEDHQLIRPINIRIGNNIYRFNVLVNSILNRNKLKGLRLQVEKFEKGETVSTMKWFKTIPLSIEAYHYEAHKDEYQEAFDKKFKGRALTQTMENQVKQTIYIEKEQ